MKHNLFLVLGSSFETLEDLSFISSSLFNEAYIGSYNITFF